MVADEINFNHTLIKDIYNLSFSNTPIKLVRKLLAYLKIRKKTNLFIRPVIQINIRLNDS